MDIDYDLNLNIVLMVLAVVMIFKILLLIYCQTFSPKINIGLLLTAICCMILLLIFYKSQFKARGRSKQNLWRVQQTIQQKVDLIILSVSGLFALLVLILIGFLMIYCQRVQNETNIEAANQTSVTNILLQNSKGTVYI